MTALGKLQCGDADLGQWPQWAVHVGRGEIVWQDRCDAANGSKEPILQNAAPGLNGREARKAGIAWQRRPFADFRQLIR